MNYNLINHSIRQLREYSQLTETIADRSKHIRSRKLQGQLPSPQSLTPLTVTGLCEGASYAFYASFIEDLYRITGKSALIIVSEERDASRLREFLTASGLRVMFYPVRDLNFCGATSSHEFEQERLRVLGAITENECEVVITVPDAACSFTMPRATLAENTIVISESDSISVSEFSTRLVDAGYSRVDLVEGIGQFSVRGDIIDVFPPLSQSGDSTEAEAVRIELFGDEIDRMGIFDISTQRFLSPLDKITLPPAREVIVSEKAKADILSALNSLLRTVANSDRRIDINAEIAAVSNNDGRIIDFADKYLSAVYPQKETILDYYDTGAPIIVCDLNSVRDRCDAAYKLLYQSVTAMIEDKTVYAKFAEYCIEPELFDEFLNSHGMINVTAFSSTVADSKNGDIFNFTAKPTVTGAAQTYTPTVKEDTEVFIKAGYRTVILCDSEPEVREIVKGLCDDGFSAFSVSSIKQNDSEDEISDTDDNVNEKIPAEAVGVMYGAYHGGFELPAVKFALINLSAAGSKRGEYSIRRHNKLKKKKLNEQKIMSYADLEVGDFVVHRNYGIGQYMGIENLAIDGVYRDYISIRYSGKDKLFLPVEAMEAITKYIGAGSADGAVKLSKMGGAEWNRAKTKAKGAAREMAKELIELYAKRMKKPGFAFAPDDEMQRDFDNSFEYVETDGQLEAIREIKADMESPHPMERLLCGDVGYGKTEVAMRAAFKAVTNGKQVAILVPTTILAFQHYTTLTSRMRGYPVTVDMISRFKNPAAQKETLRKLRRGDIDIIVGTHRIVSNDIVFKDLGLVIIDEEQRFGVAQKEKLKQIAPNVDVLTLTATPIPRTLNMAMSGIRDMSVLEEAPENRLPVQTYVIEHDDAVITEAMRRELRRGGQVFYLHNKVEDIFDVAAKIQKALPDSRVAAAHGQMDRNQIEEIWSSLVQGETDILVSTTIIETGVDVPNANTLIIENADKMGLAQLHQLRGRVGRSSRRAYAYFTYQKGKTLTDIAEKRLGAIRDFTAFGAGFKIALRDMEIRGAGNILGAEQHGHLESVGYDLYIKLLNDAILEEKGETPKKEVECAVSFKIDAFLPQSYVSASAQRMDMYKKIAHIENQEDYHDICDELSDRYGEPPAEAMNLLKVSLIRGFGKRAGITKIDERDGAVHLYPEKLDIALWSKIFDSQKGALRVETAGGVPHIARRLAKGETSTAAAMSVLEAYIKTANL